MIPYVDFFYFGLVAYVAAPALVLSLLRVRGRWWAVAATLLMLGLQYNGWLRLGPGPKMWVREIWLVMGYAAFQWLVAAGFLETLSELDSPTAVPVYVAVALAIAPLVVAKFSPLVSPKYPLGFLGISYLTFRSLDVIIGMQDRLIRRLPPAQYLAYLLFFPTVSSGPIDRYRRFAQDWERRRTRAESLADLDGAVHRIFTGFLYKFILAYLVRKYWMDPVAEHYYGPLVNLSYMYAYSLYLFFDFAGYSAFAIGVGYLFGVHTPENFDRPFLSHNIRDFWNRWHISLSWWFRDHVYMRFVMAATRRRWFRSKHTASYLGFFLSMGLMGLWHGVAWHFILYGLYHAALLVGFDFLSRWNKGRQRRLWGDGPLWRAAGIFVTFNAVCFGLLLFSGRLGS